MHPTPDASSRPPRSPWPGRTTARAGLLLLLGGAVLLIADLGVEVPLLETLVVPLWGWIPRLVAGILLGAAFTVLAFGAGHEVDVVAGSAIGRTGLLLPGWRLAAFTVLDAATADADVPAMLAIGWGELAYSALAAAGLVAAAVVLARRRVLVGVARWLLLPLAAVEVLLLAPQLLPLGIDVLLVLAVVPIGLAEPVVLLAMGVALLLYSRSEAVKHRARIVYDAW